MDSTFQVSQYNVICDSCDQVWQPPINSPEWWIAKQFEKRHPERLDAPCVPAHICGCEEKKERNLRMYKVFGYDCMCSNFEFSSDNFVKTVKFNKSLSGMDTFCVVGMQQKTVDRLIWGEQWGK